MNNYKSQTSFKVYQWFLDQGFSTKHAFAKIDKIIERELKESK